MSLYLDLPPPSKRSKTNDPKSRSDPPAIAAAADALTTPQDSSAPNLTGKDPRPPLPRSVKLNKRSAGLNLLPQPVVSRATISRGVPPGISASGSKLSNGVATGNARPTQSASPNGIAADSKSWGTSNHTSTHEFGANGRSGQVNFNRDVHIPGLHTVVRAPDIHAPRASFNKAVAEPLRKSRAVIAGALPSAHQEYNPRQPNDYFVLTRHRREGDTDLGKNIETDATSKFSRDLSPTAPVAKHDGPVSNEQVEGDSGSVQNPAQPQARAHGPRSRVIVLSNMALPGQVDGRLHTETHRECSRLGKVTSLVVYEIPGHTVRVFVKFESIDAARRAKDGLEGRWFEGRQVQAHWFDEVRFDKLDLGFREGDEF